MSGVLARLVAQTVVFVVQVATKSFAAAYQKAQAGGGAAAGAARGAAGAAGASSSSGMSVSQAREILNFSGAKYTRDEVIAQFEKHYHANDPDRGGSFYVQSKVFQAKDTLLSELKRRKEDASAATTGAAAAGNGSAAAGAKMR